MIKPIGGQMDTDEQDRIYFNKYDNIADEVNRKLFCLRIGESSQDANRRSHKRQRTPSPDDSPHVSHRRHYQPRDESNEQQAKKASNDAIIGAEKFRAVINQPRGNIPYPITDKIDKMLAEKQMEEITDDDFFHTISHIDISLKEKIQLGEYIELEKLLEKNLKRFEDENGTVQELRRGPDGQAYFMPKKGETKINGLRKWEQAFRIYAGIYCMANPSRSSEIWQYVDVNNQAAAKFNWENVSAYDIKFRYLMAANPRRSWAKTYTQMWNLTLCGDGRNNTGGNGNTSLNRTHNNNNNGNRKSGNWRDNCCWRYNKSKCSYGPNCRFDHRCTYCGAFGHPSQNCPKKNDRRNSGETSREGHRDKKKDKRRSRHQQEDDAA